MVFFKQLLSITALSLMAELASIYLRVYVFIPAPVVGIILLVAFLKLGIFREDFLNALAPNLVYHMGIFLVPATVGLMKYYYLIKKNLLFFSISIIVISTLSIVLTALASSFILKFSRGGR